jgi:hypothetical protein
MNFILNPRANQIFYADAFIIEGKGCLIMGHGKTSMGKLASDKVRENEIGPDQICLIRDGNTLYGQYDLDLVPDTYVPKPHVIHHMVRCLNKDETAAIFQSNVRKLFLTSYDRFVQLCQFNITFTIDPMGTMRARMGEAYAEHVSPQKRIERFRQLTASIPGMQFIVLPWMDTVEEKVLLLREHLKAI